MDTHIFGLRWQAQRDTAFAYAGQSQSAVALRLPAQSKWPRLKSGACVELRRTRFLSRLSSGVQRRVRYRPPVF
jgi:hypothetical protein